ncbi:MAG: hypothetical protein QGF82_04045 [Candidatus Marinimicrobia bacterium]|nr:hypothetical protein [Candidatus Neomarinimicrobiota bacterium]
MRQFIAIFTILICLNIISAQDRTAISIVCDTPEIPIYVDGQLMGYTPLDQDVDVLPGWHTVSFFPNIEDGDLDTRKVSRDILRMGTQDVLVEVSETVFVSMAYSKLGQDIDGYYNSVRTGNYFGFSMIIVLISIWVWAYV